MYFFNHKRQEGFHRKYGIAFAIAIVSNDIFMKTVSIQQELLLMTGTTFANRQWANINSSVTNSNSTKQKLIEHERYSSILPGLLPEIFYNNNEETKLYLWLIRHGHSYIQLELCEKPLVIDMDYTLDPYLYLSVVNYN